MSKKKSKKNDPKPIVKAGVGVIVVKGRKVLIGLRQGSHGEGLYAFPGGHLDPEDTSLWSCGEREVMEETGMLVKCFSPDHFRQELFTTFDILSEDGQKVYVTPYLVAEYLHGGEQIKKGDKERVRPLEDKCEYWEWVTLDALVELMRQEKEFDDAQQSWIPLQQVLFYLKQMWGE
jgi:8-oxo-dGTP diphosphatase